MCEGVKGYRKLLGTLVNVGAFASIINDGLLFNSFWFRESVANNNVMVKLITIS